MGVNDQKTHKIWKYFLVLGLILLLGFIFACLVYIFQLIKTGQWQEGQELSNRQSSEEKLSESTLKQMTKDSYWIGAAKPKVTIIEFADFSCSMCGNSFPNIREISSKYKNDVKIIFKDFPVVSSYSTDLALAANCAGEQGLFWPMHDKLFINQGISKETELVEMARQIGASTTRFTTCFEKKKYATQVNQDYEDGKTLGVSGTPTWFVNGTKIEGDIPRATFMNIIENLLK